MVCIIMSELGNGFDLIIDEEAWEGVGGAFLLFISEKVSVFTRWSMGYESTADFCSVAIPWVFHHC